MVQKLIDFLAKNWTFFVKQYFRTKHRKINLVLTLDELIFEVSKNMKKMKKEFSTISTFLTSFFKFLENRISSRIKHLACRLHDIRNLIIKSNKKKLRVLPHFHLSLGAP